MLTSKLKIELVEYVLLKSPVWLLNIAIKEYSTQRLYARFKRELMSDYKELMPGNLKYAIAMAEAFSEYNCDEIQCKDLLFKIKDLSYKLKLAKSYYSKKYTEYATEHNALVDKYREAIKPQQKLIRLYKRLHKLNATAPR